MASSKARPGPHDRKPDPVTGELAPRARCIRLTRAGVRCRRFALGKSKLCRTHKLLAEAALLEGDPDAQGDDGRPASPRGRARARIHPNYRGGPNPEPGDLVKAGLGTRLRREAERRSAGQDPQRRTRRNPRGLRSELGLQSTRPGVLMPKSAPGLGPNSKIASTLVVSEQARVALHKLGQEVDSRLDPKLVLLDTVNSAWRQRQVWEQMLSAIPEEDWEQLGKTPIPGVMSSAKGARIEAIQKHLSDATKVAARTSKLAIDAGIEERLVRIAEEQSALIADTVRAGIIAGISILRQQGLITQAGEAAAIEAAVGSAATHLRQLAAGAESPSDIFEGHAERVS